VHVAGPQPSRQTVTLAIEQPEQQQGVLAGGLEVSVASHCKPWRDSSNEECLDGENGPLLTPSIDHLFDRGFIGFEDHGDLILSLVAHLPSLERMGIETRCVINVGGFTESQRTYLDFHRNAVLLRAVR
jgi:putative restriction endonuclease